MTDTYKGDTDPKRLARLEFWQSIDIRPTAEHPALVFASRDGADVRLLHDGLGVPAGCIVAVDREPDALAECEARHPGKARYVLGDVTDLVERDGINPSIALLDFCEPLGSATCKTVGAVASAVVRNGVLGVAVLKGRDCKNREVVRLAVPERYKTARLDADSSKSRRERLVDRKWRRHLKRKGAPAGLESYVDEWSLRDRVRRGDCAAAAELFARELGGVAVGADFVEVNVGEVVGRIAKLRSDLANLGIFGECEYLATLASATVGWSDEKSATRWTLLRMMLNNDRQHRDDAKWNITWCADYKGSSPMAMVQLQLAGDERDVTVGKMPGGKRAEAAVREMAIDRERWTTAKAAAMLDLDPKQVAAWRAVDTMNTRRAGRQLSPAGQGERRLLRSSRPRWWSPREQEDQ